jgi:hypothetical protein
MSEAANVDRLAGTLRAALHSRSRTALVPFLEAVYVQYDTWRSDRRALVSSEKLAAEFELPVRSDSHAVRILLEACCKRAGGGINEKTLSEWTMCIRKAWRRRGKWETFSEFIKHNGGISGAAALLPKLPRYRRSDF